MEKWKANMNNLLIFVGAPHTPKALLVLTSIKAALFTGIVTAFVLDAMSDFGEDAGTALLRILVEQSITNSTTEMPPPNPSSSILTVSSLWFLSIMFSLAATTWAILCLEWCAFLPDGVQAEDYEEMAEKRQRRFEAMKCWKMHLIIAVIPLFLHLSLFLFLSGLWLRLRDVNKQLGLIVGVSSLVIVSSYVVVTLLPVFTNAPFPTSASEVVLLFVGWIWHAAESLRFIRRPRAFSWVANLLPMGSSSWFPASFNPFRIRRLTLFLKHACRKSRRYLRAAWKKIAFLPIFPTFRPDQNPFNELNKLKVGHSDRDKGIHQRALFWLLNTPLSKDEVREILQELGERRYNDGKPLDRAIIRLLVLSLSSILEDDYVSDDEQPIFDHCTTVLAREMDRAFGDGEHYQRILFRNATIADKLSPHFPPATTDGDWTRAVSALWLCPSTEGIRDVVNRLDSNIQSVGVPDLQRIIRGLHAATLTCFNLHPNPPNLNLIPDFTTWSWDSDTSDQVLDKALSGYLQCLFAAFYNTLHRHGDPTTAASLVVDCLGALDGQPNPGTLRLHNALCFFVAITQRSNPRVFEEGPSVALALLDSAESWRKYSGEGDLKGAEVLTVRLRAITYGPRFLLPGKNRPLTRLGDIYDGLPHSIKADQRCIEGFLDANAATLEALLAAGGPVLGFIWKRSLDYRTARNICTNPSSTDGTFDFVRQHPNYRLPYLYSLAIALSYVAEGRNQGLWKVADLFITRDQQQGIAVDRVLDTNILVVAVLRFALHHQSEAMGQEWKNGFLDLVQNIVIDGTDWRTRWKAVYLITDLVCLLSRMGGGDGQKKALIDAASNYFDDGGLERVPSDWERKRKGLALCKLETIVRSLVSTRGETGEGIYEWSGQEKIPYLSLYNPRRTEAVSNAVFWATSVFQRWVQLS